MTEHVCTNPNHDHFDPSRFSPAQQASIAKAQEAHDAARALPSDETKVLLAGQTMLGVQGLLREVVQMLAASGSPDPGVVQALTAALALNSLGAVGLESLSNDHDDWHSSGDRRVDAVFETLTEALEALTQGPPMIAAEDLPEDLAERLLKGESTPEDKETVRKMAVERGLIPEDADFDLLAQNLDTGEVTKPTTQEPSTGMYL